ncbi:MAG: MBOAT family O-acyltransferase [Bacteroidia bacterium]|jgi:alginate O-acetyltransferase complex protein AlgI
MDIAKIGDLLKYSPEEPMLFNSGLFFFLFTLFLAGYSFLYKHKKARILYILIFSLYFYYKSSGAYVLILCGTVLTDYYISLKLHQIKDALKRKLFLIASILLNVGFLLYFKYTNFFIENIGFLTGWELQNLDIFLPIGVSFYTFQSLSYIIDVYKRELEPAKNFYDFAFYMTFFPHLVAGPIVRAKFFLPQIDQELYIDRKRVSDGLFLILRGLLKKAVIADYISQYNDFIFGNIGGYSNPEVMLAMYAYAVQIYCDFSGYSDMAIGIARIMGYELGDNFNAPYSSISLSDFWRRWHMSLSSWLRDYIYIPLGGNKKGKLRQDFNLFFTMLVAGFWHGPSWSFVIWGCLHGLGLFIDKSVSKIWPSKVKAHWAFKVGATLLTFHVVAFLWLLFRIQSISEAWLAAKKSFFGIGEMIQSVFTAKYRDLIFQFLDHRLLIIFSIILVLTITQIKHHHEERLFDRFMRLPLLVKGLLFIALIQWILNIQSAEVKPFIYFQF